MSSYLTIYAKLKGAEKPAPLLSWSRNNKVYQACKNYVTYIGNDEKMKFSEITINLINNSIDELKEDNKNSEKYLNEYEKYASNNPDYIQSIVELKEEIEETNRAINELNFVKTMVEELNCNYPEDGDENLVGIEKYLANID